MARKKKRYGKSNPWIRYWRYAARQGMSQVEAGRKYRAGARAPKAGKGGKRRSGYRQPTGFAVPGIQTFEQRLKMYMHPPKKGGARRRKRHGVTLAQTEKKLKSVEKKVAAARILEAHRKQVAKDKAKLRRTKLAQAKELKKQYGAAAKAAGVKMFGPSRRQTAYEAQRQAAAERRAERKAMGYVDAYDAGTRRDMEEAFYASGYEGSPRRGKKGGRRKAKKLSRSRKLSPWIRFWMAASKRGMTMKEAARQYKAGKKSPSGGKKRKAARKTTARKGKRRTAKRSTKRSAKKTMHRKTHRRASPARKKSSAKRRSASGGKKHHRKGKRKGVRRDLSLSDFLPFG